jgi:hypothetical protein
MPIFTCARAKPMVWTNSAIRCFCAAKCMLDAGVDLGARGVRLGLKLGEPAARWTAELDPLRQRTSFQDPPGCASCGRRFPPRRGWPCCWDPGEPESCGCHAERIGHRPAADQAMPSVDADVAFVAEDRHGDLDGLAPCSLWCGLGSPALERPAGIPVLLRPLGR